MVVTKPGSSDIELGRSRPEGCLSDRALDMLMAGELPAARRAATEAHLPSCEACRARYQALQAGAAAFSLDAPSFQKLAPLPRRHRWWWALAPSVAVAAVLLVVIRSPQCPSDERRKGGDAVAFFVWHGGTVREGARRERVHPGDRLQLVTTTAAPRYLVVLERDAGGHASVFFPRETEAARREAGRAVPLPFSIELDGTLGIGTIYAVFCDRPVPVAPLRDSLERQNAEITWPSGCHADRLSYETTPP